eukprot:3114732-Pyramimonas_sp.AAC.1
MAPAPLPHHRCTRLFCPAGAMLARRSAMPRWVLEGQAAAVGHAAACPLLPIGCAEQLAPSGSSA